jgi:hypothetical protein
MWNRIYFYKWYQLFKKLLTSKLWIIINYDKAIILIKILIFVKKNECKVYCEYYDDSYYKNVI